MSSATTPPPYYSPVQSQFDSLLMLEFSTRPLARPKPELIAVQLEYQMGDIEDDLVRVRNEDR